MLVPQHGAHQGVQEDAGENRRPYAARMRGKPLPAGRTDRRADRKGYDDKRDYRHYCRRERA